MPETTAATVGKSMALPLNEIETEAAGRTDADTPSATVKPMPRECMRVGSS